MNDDPRPAENRSRAANGGPSPDDAKGCKLHFGYVFFVVVPGFLIFLFLGWKRLWLLLPWCAALWLFFFVLTMVEDRWRMVTAEDAARGVPADCDSCGHELDVYRRNLRYTVRCPICGFKKKGVLSPIP